MLFVKSKRMQGQADFWFHHTTRTSHILAVVRISKKIRTSEFHLKLVVGVTGSTYSYEPITVNMESSSSFYFFFYYSLSSIFMKTFFLWPLMTLTSTQTCAVTNEWHWFFMTPCCYSIFILIRILLWFYYFQIRCWKMKHQPNRIWLRQCTPCDRKIMHRTMRCRMIGRVSLPLARVCCTPIFRRKTSHPVSQVSDFCYSLFLFFRSVCLWQEKIIKILHPFLFLQSITTTTKRCVKFTLHRSQPVIYGLHIVCISIAVISLIYVADIHNTKLDNNNKKYKMCMNIIEKAHSENHVTILKYSIWNTEIFSCILK